MVVLYGLRVANGRQEALKLLHLALEMECDLSILPDQARLPGGKPWFPAQPDLHFNVSHSGGLVVCGLGDTPVGVDIELLRPRSPRLADYVLSSDELAWFSDRGRQWGDFYTLWTLKESLCKCTGQGLDRPARTLSVPLLSPGEAAQWGGFHFCTYGGADWRAAACTVEPGTISKYLRTPAGFVGL